MTLTLIISIFKLVTEILSQYFQAAERARVAKEKYELSQAEFDKLVLSATTKLRQDLSKDSAQTGTLDDAMDTEIRKRDE